jgi:hypothetical protein
MNSFRILPVAAILFGLTPSIAMAETSCSEWRATCRGTALNRKMDPKVCDEAWNKCMKTGHWIGPDSGRDYGTSAKR